MAWAVLLLQPSPRLIGPSTAAPPRLVQIPGGSPDAVDFLFHRLPGVSGGAILFFKTKMQRNHQDRKNQASFFTQ